MWLQGLTSGKPGVNCVPIHQLRLSSLPAQIYEIAIHQGWEVNEASFDALDENTSIYYRRDQLVHFFLDLLKRFMGLNHLLFSLFPTVRSYMLGFPLNLPPNIG